MRRFLLAFILLIGSPFVGAATPQSTAFTYQGDLSSDGQPADGNFDMNFQLFDAEIGGLPIGNPVNVQHFPVEDGLFTIDLDFPGVFTGPQRWLEVTVEGEVLSPRQPVSSVPVAQFGLGGPAGAQGQVGPQGPSSLVTATFNGPVGTFPASATEFSFGTTTASIVVTTSNQRLTGMATVPLATSAGTTSVDFGLCYRQGAGPITLFAGPLQYQTSIATTIRRTFSTASSVTAPTAGVYTVGFCARATDPNALNINSRVNGFVQTAPN